MFAISLEEGNAAGAYSKMSAIFHQAVLEGDTTKVKFILKYGQGIRVNQPNKHGVTALQQACINGNLSMANFLLESGADLKVVDCDGRSALHLASERGHLDIVSLLINSTCVDVNARDSFGKKAVDVAQNEQVRALLSQAILSESFKQRCGVSDSWDHGNFDFKNVPGWRNSISSTSTDSGVSEDSTFSQDSGLDYRYPSRYYKTANNVERFCDSYTCDTNRQQRAERGDFICARRVEPIARQATVIKSNSFTGSRHEYSDKLESAALENDEDTHGGRYDRRQNKNRRDPSRRKTVTFGESEAYYISSNEEQWYPKLHSMYQAPASVQSGNRYPSPGEGWDTTSNTYHKSNLARFTQRSGSILRENVTSLPVDEHRNVSPRGENIKRNIHPGFSDI